MGFTRHNFFLDLGIAGSNGRTGEYFFYENSWPTLFRRKEKVKGTHKPKNERARGSGQFRTENRLPGRRASAPAPVLRARGRGRWPGKQPAETASPDCGGMLRRESLPKRARGKAGRAGGEARARRSCHRPTPDPRPHLQGQRALLMSTRSLERPASPGAHSQSARQEAERRGALQCRLVA